MREAFGFGNKAAVVDKERDAKRERLGSNRRSRAQATRPLSE